MPAPSSPANGATVAALPTFAWGAASHANHYQFELAADPNFNSAVHIRGQDIVTTYNTRATADLALTGGTYYWRVRSVNALGTANSAWSQTRSFVLSRLAQPVLQSPSYDPLAGPTPVTYPTPLTLTWAPVAGAVQYRVTISTDPTLSTLAVVDPNDSTKPYPTEATSMSPVRLAPGVYYWSVTPYDAEGHAGAPSAVSAFRYIWPSTTNATVVDLQSSDPQVFEPRFSWDAVDGASKYEIEVSVAADFASGSDVYDGYTLGTVLSLQRNLNDVDTYYWRVRAIDPWGHAGVWNTGYYDDGNGNLTDGFTEAFDAQNPGLPNLRLRDNVNDPTVDANTGTASIDTATPIVTWDRVPGAAGYDVDVTTYVPAAAHPCDWTLPQTSQWQVRTTVNAWTPIQLKGGAVQPPYSPPNNQLLNIPYDMASLSPGSSYCVRVRAFRDTDQSNTPVYGPFTYIGDGDQQASFTWTGYAGGSCTQPCSSGYLGAADYLEPVTGTLTASTPLLTWNPIDVGGAPAESYWVIVSSDANFTNIVDYALTRVPAYAPRGMTGAPRTYADKSGLYYWAVLPAPNDDGSGAGGRPDLANASSFQLHSQVPTLDPVTFYPLAPAHAPSGAPTFQWSPVPGALYYHLQVANDPTFANGSIIDDQTHIAATSYTPADTTYPADHDLSWRVMAVYQNQTGTVEASPSLTGTFRKTFDTIQVDPSVPTIGSVIPIFSWGHIEGAVSYHLKVIPPGANATPVESNPDAVDAQAIMQGMQGTGNFQWQVRANYPTLNGTIAGPWTSLRTYTKTLPEPTGLAAATNGTHQLVFSWQPELRVKSYRVQVSTSSDFTHVFDDETTETTNYAPTLPPYLAGYGNGGKLYWRVAARDSGDNVGDWATGTVTLPLKLNLTQAAGWLSRGQTNSITIAVKDGNGRAVSGVKVAASGAGVRATTLKTGTGGKVTFRLKPTRRGTVTFTASKTGAVTTKLSVTIF